MNKNTWIINPVSSILTLQLLLVSLTGCVTSPTYIDTANPTATKSSGVNSSPVHYRVDQNFKNSPPRCVAVLPLTTATVESAKTSGNAKKNKDLILSEEKLQKIRSILYSHLSPLPYKDVELGDIDKVLGRKSLNTTEHQAIGTALDCDALLVGEMTVHESSFLGFYSQSSIGARLKLINAQDSAILWEGEHVASSHAGSVPITPIDIAMGIFHASENVSEEQAVRVTDDLFRRLLTTWVQEPSFAPKMMIAEQEGYPFSISSQKLVLRSGPGKSYSAKSMLYRNEKVTMLSNSHSTSPWAQVKLSDGRSGFVYKKYIQKIDGMNLTHQ